MAQTSKFFLELSDVTVSITKAITKAVQSVNNFKFEQLVFKTRPISRSLNNNLIVANVYYMKYFNLIFFLISFHG